MATKAKEKGTAVAVAEKPKGLVAQSDLASVLMEDMGLGTENAQKGDMSIPFLQLIQALSPQVDEQHPKYVEGAKAGMLVNTVTGELYDIRGEENGVRIIPVHFDKVYNEFVPRAAGGGFVKSHLSEDEAHANKRQDTEIVDTANHYVLVLDDEGNAQWAVLSMTSTKLKISRKWVTRMKLLQVTDAASGKKFTPPSFGTVWLLSSVPERNDKGSFHNFKVEFEGLVDSPELYAQAKAFRQALLEGAARVDFNQAPENQGDVAVEDDEASRPQNRRF